MRTIKTLFQNKVWMKGMLGIAACLTFFCLNGFVSEAAEGTVKADTAKIRAQASTGSEVVGSTVKGKVIDIVGVETDSSGMKWYKVPIAGGSYGYIRSDLVDAPDNIASETSSTQTSSSETSTTSEEKPAATVPTAITEQKAVISQPSVRIRSGASTKHDTVSSLPQGTSITLIGEANDSAGNKWYQMTCSYNNKTIEGYVRSDLITIGGSANTSSEGEENSGEASSEGENPEAEGTEGENTEGENTEGEGEEQEPSEPAETEYNDYEIVYNEGTYWLYNNLDGNMMKVEDVLNVVNTANENNEKLQGKLQSEKIIIIILAVIIVILVVAVTVLLFKIRDLYYEDYDEEEEDEEVEEEPVVVKKKKKRPEPEEEEPVPVKKKRPVSQEVSGEKERSARQRPAQEAELKAAERKQPAKKPPQRKAQNFLLDDDEFEFEFLNMDDKDL